MQVLMSLLCCNHNFLVPTPSNKIYYFLLKYIWHMAVLIIFFLIKVHYFLLEYSFFTCKCFWLLRRRRQICCSCKCLSSQGSQQGFRAEISIKKLSHIAILQLFSLIQSDQDIFFACYAPFFPDKTPKGN